MRDAQRDTIRQLAQEAVLAEVRATEILDRDGWPIQLAPVGADGDDIRHGGNRAAIR